MSSEWWRSALREWASLIDVVVVLDAPDHVLAQRIRARHRHEVKEFPDHEIARWMARFREALEWVLAGWPPRRTVGGSPVLAERTADRIAEQLTKELSGRHHAG